MGAFEQEAFLLIPLKPLSLRDFQASLLLWTRAEQG